MKDTFELAQKLKISQNSLATTATNSTPMSEPTFMFNPKMERETKSSQAFISNIEIDKEQGINVYNVETNNNFQLLDNSSNETSKNEQDMAIKDEKPRQTKVDHINYKEFLQTFLEDFKESPTQEPKYPQAATKMMKNGYNMFHLSLLDMGKFNPNLKGFMAAEEKNLYVEIKALVQQFIDKMDLGEVNNGLLVSVNKKNYGQ